MPMRGSRFRCGVCLVVAVVAGLLAGCEQTGGDVETADVRTTIYPAAGETMLVVESDRGTVEIRGEADRTDIDVTTTIRARGTSLEQARARIDELGVAETRTGDALYLAFRVPQTGTTWRASADFVVLVPARTSLDVIGEDVDVTIKGVSGTIQVDVQDGRVAGRRLAGEVHVGTALTLPGEGDVDLDEVNGVVTIATESGVVTIHAISGALDVTTESGDVVVRGADLDRFTVQSKTGDVEFSGRLTGTGAAHDARTNRGDVHFRIPVDSRLRIEAEVSIGGSITSALPLSDDAEGKEWSALLNAPDATLHLKSLDGRILIGRLYET